MKLLQESCLRKILRHILSQEDYAIVSSKIKDCSKVSAIPIEYIKHYGNKHDAVCQSNLENLVNSYIKDGGLNYDQIDLDG